MKNKILIVIAAVVFLVTMVTLVPQWTKVTEVKSTVFSSSQPSPYQQGSTPYMTGMPLQYTIPWGEPMILLDNTMIADVFSLWDYTPVDREFYDFVKSFQRSNSLNDTMFVGVTNSGLFSTNLVESYTPLNLQIGALPPVVYNPSNSNQQSPR